MRAHVRYLDGLRGLAILGVFSIHWTQAAGVADTAIGHLAAFGRFGVQLFFMVSAYTLMLSQGDRPFNGRNFVARRFFRIAPMFYLATTAFLILRGLGPRYYAPSGIHSWQIVQNLTFTHGWAPDATNAIMPGAWSLSCEAFFYACFPLALAILKTPARAVAAFCLSVPLCYLAQRYAGPLLVPDQPAYLAHDFAYFMPASQLCAFLGGFVAYRVRALVPPAAARTGLAVSGAGLLGCAVAGVYFYPLIVALLVAFVTSAVSAPPRWLSFRPLAFLGLVSFSVYVLHHMAIDAAQTLGVTGIGGYLGSLAVTLAAATATWFLIEKPMIDFGRTVGRRACGIAEQAVKA